MGLKYGFFISLGLGVSAVAMADLAPKAKALTNQLNAAIAAQVQEQEKLVKSKQDLDNLAAEIAREKQSMSGDVQTFQAGVMALVRYGEYPEILEYLRQVEGDELPRLGGFKVVQEDIMGGLRQRAIALKGLHEQQRQMLLAQVEQAEVIASLARKQRKLAALQRKVLKQLAVDDAKLAKRLQYITKARPKTVKVDTAVDMKPIEWPTVGVYRANALEAAIDKHGVEIEGLPGTDVYALKPGQVTYSAPFRDYGWLVIVHSDDGTNHVYGGLAANALPVGAHVGEKGAVGVLPNTENPRLYVELRRGDRFLPIELR